MSVLLEHWEFRLEDWNVPLYTLNKYPCVLYGKGITGGLTGAAGGECGEEHRLP